MAAATSTTRTTNARTAGRFLLNRLIGLAANARSRLDRRLSRQRIECSPDPVSRSCLVEGGGSYFPRNATPGLGQAIPSVERPVDYRGPKSETNPTESRTPG